jgi:hypothetical protein
LSLGCIKILIPRRHQKKILLDLSKLFIQILLARQTENAPSWGIFFGRFSIHVVAKMTI